MLQGPKKQTQLPLTSSVTAPDLLINWESPPSSPTPGRSSSDGLSLRSFGSDSSGTTANGAFSTMTRSESGFESEPDAWSETVTAPPAKTGKCTHTYLVENDFPPTTLGTEPVHLMGGFRS